MNEEEARGGTPIWQTQPPAPETPGLLEMMQAANIGSGAFAENSEQPINVGPAPAYQSGTTFGGYNSIFDPRAPSVNGGFFTMQDYLKDHPEKVGGPTGSGNSPSTNNWRLLPPNWRTPDHFMFNGGIISRGQAGRDLTGKSVMGQETSGHPGYRPLGGGMWAMPTGSYAWDQGYIGSLGNWGVGSTSTY